MKKLSRRELLAFFPLAACSAAPFQERPGQGNPLDSLKFKKETALTPRPALFFEKLPDKKIRCTLCPQSCTVADAERGMCGVRENTGGEYCTLVHSRVCALHVDPVEKKPLFHYRPGTLAFSLATAGCNMECQYCQNWQISQFRPEQVESQLMTPETLVNLCVRSGAPTIAYTYSEPVVFYEFMSDIAAAAKDRNIGNVMISNGYIQAEPLRKLIPRLSAIKVDFKGFSDDFYKRVCRGTLKPVLEALQIMAASGIWLELVMLVVPALNDAPAENAAMFKWIRQNLGDSVPVHLTRFHPMYKLQNLPPTPVRTLERLHQSALDTGLKFVYLGNVPGHPAEHTYCPSCRKLLIRRTGFLTGENLLAGNRCPACRTVIPGVFLS